MLREPLKQTASTPQTPMYEYGEYDGLVDLDAVLHAGGSTTTTTTDINAAATSPTANSGCHTGGDTSRSNGNDGVVDYTHYVTLHGTNGPHLGSGEPGPTPSPNGRSSARKPTRDSSSRGGTSASADRHHAPHGGYPMSALDGDVTVTTAPTTTAVVTAASSAPNARSSANTQRRRGESASGSRANPTTTAADTGVHLPVILPSQQRRPTDGPLQSRVRVSPLTQEHGSPVPSNTNNASSSANTPHNARSATSLSPPGQNTRPVGAKTVMSANNLAALQRSGNERAHTGALSTSNSSNRVPPYLAPPLSPLHSRTNPPQPSMAPLNRPATDGCVKRGESAEGGERNSPTRRSNGWVKEEARRIDRTSQEIPSGFPQERVRQSSAAAAAAAAPLSSGKADETSGPSKVNTSPAPSAPRAPVWASDYEMGRGDLVGCTATPDFGAMPRVAAPPLPFRAKKTLSDSGKRTAPLRPTPPHIPSTPPVGTTTSPVESTILPLRTAAQRSAQRPMNATGATAASTASPAAATAVAAASYSAAGPGSGAGRTNPAIATAGATAATADATSGLHTPGTTHRRVMNAVDTHSGTPSDLSRVSKTMPAVVLLNNDKANISSFPNSAPSAAAQKMPYSDDRRAALEAWAAFPAMDVTMRNQAPTAMQLRRAQDFATVRPVVVRQLYQSVKGQAPQEFAGEPFEMNYDVHNVVVQLRHRNRPLMMAYPPQLPLELDTRPRLRRQRTPRSFYGTRFPHVGDAWFRNALDDARHIDSPDIESMEKQEEEEFVRNGGDPAHRRNRYGQANSNNNNNNNNQQQQQQRAPPHSGTGAPNIDHINRNAVRMEQPAV